MSNAPSLLSRIVAVRQIDNFLCDTPAELQPHPDIGWEVNAAPNAGLACFIRERVQRLGISRKQVAQRAGGSAREAAVRRRRSPA